MWRIAKIPGITFALFLVWKVVLLLATSQPVPFCDAFFYDGPVVNYLLHGKYCNPSIAPALPISGTELFSAYPPLHQGALLLWMSVFGTSALSAMWYQLLLLAGFAAVTYSTLKMLRAPAAALNWAGLFCFGITFHDRPDSLAYLFGALAVWSCVRARTTATTRWFWAAAGLLVLALSASLQIGGIYLVLTALLAFGGAMVTRTRIPWLPCLACITAICGLILFVVVGCPRFWAGFQEHVKVTPSVTGWRVPSVFELLKVGRAVAGISLVAAALVWLAIAGKLRFVLRDSPSMLVTMCAALTTALLAGGCLVFFFADMIRYTTYLQPLAVGAFFTACAGELFSLRLRRTLNVLFVVAALVVSVRALGMTTWGVLCARDMSYAKATATIRHELDAVPTGSTVVLSSAYLYDAAQRTNIHWILSEWAATPGAKGGDVGGFVRLRPGRFILTQYDFYWRFEPAMRELQALPDPPEFKVRNTAGIAVPDANPKLRKPLKHLSWAPVIVDCTWPPDRKSP